VGVGFCDAEMPFIVGKCAAVAKKESFVLDCSVDRAPITPVRVPGNRGQGARQMFHGLPASSVPSL